MQVPETSTADALQEQLEHFSQQQEYLERELGVSDAHELVAMVRSLEAQLIDLYAQKEEENAK